MWRSASPISPNRAHAVRRLGHGLRRGRRIGWRSGRRARRPAWRVDTRGGARRPGRPTAVEVHDPGVAEFEEVLGRRAGRRRGRRSGRWRSRPDTNRQRSPSASAARRRRARPPSSSGRAGSARHSGVTQFLDGLGLVATRGDTAEHQFVVLGGGRGVQLDDQVVVELVRHPERDAEQTGLPPAEQPGPVVRPVAELRGGRAYPFTGLRRWPREGPGRRSRPGPVTLRLGRPRPPWWAPTGRSRASPTQPSGGASTRF